MQQIYSVHLLQSLCGYIKMYTLYEKGRKRMPLLFVVVATSCEDTHPWRTSAFPIHVPEKDWRRTK